MKTKSILLTTFLLLITLWVGAAEFDKATYYSAANNTCGATLKTKMRTIINGECNGVQFSQMSYGSGYLNGVWGAFQTTDCVAGTSTIIDRYSCITSYTVGTDQGSSSSEEGKGGYNREHSFPKSWFGGSTSAGPGTDLFHIYPTDVTVNNKRSAYPFGEVRNASFTSSGAYPSKLGTGGYGSQTSYTVFEPADKWKGDFARTYFYMVTCYENDIVSWYNNYSNTDVTKVLNGTKYPAFQTWYLDMMLKWAENDPVDEIETARNEAVMAKQHNRNPFIDYPGLEQYIWGTFKTTNVSINNYVDPYNGTPPAPTPSITLSPATASLTVGNSLTLTATTQNATGATVTWTSSNTSVATVTGGTVTALAEGTAVITAKITVGGTTYSATCDVTVTRNETPPVVGGDYVKVTSAPADWSGTYLIVCEDASVALNGALSSLDVVSNTISVSPTNNQITSTPTTEAAEFTIASRTSGGYSIMTKGGTYIGHSGSNNALKTSSSDDFENGISVSDGNVTITCNGKNLRFNSSSGQTRFRYFGSDQTAIQLYKKTESAPAVPGITLDQTSVTEEVGSTFTLTATTQNADGATVVWASSNPQVATVNDGLVRCVASGATSISATITVNGVSVAATCNVTVVDNSSSGGDGTLDNPYSVAEVLALFASNSVPTSNVYVKGIISRITSLNTSVYTNARYYISDDGSETGEFYVYNGKYLEGADFTSDDQIQTGDEVVIYGKLTTYNTINEFAAGNYIVSLKRPSSVLLGDVNRDGYVTIADVTALVNIILGKATEGDSNNYDFQAANVNQDEDITIADVTALVNLILHKE